MRRKNIETFFLVSFVLELWETSRFFKEYSKFLIL